MNNNQQNKEAQYLHNQAIWEQQQHTQTKIQELREEQQKLLLDAMTTSTCNEAGRELIARNLAEANGITKAIYLLQTVKPLKQ